MTVKKKGGSSTESSSASTGSSSSSSSSSDSDSSSSSGTETSSSQASAKQNSSTENKKTANLAPKASRKSTDSKSAPPTKPAEVKTAKPKQSAPKILKPTIKIEISSTDDEEINKNQNKTDAKKKSNVKPKSSATVTPVAAKAPPTKTPSSSTSKSSASKSVSSKSTPSAKPDSKAKESVKSNKTPRSSKKKDTSKQKSIFSPENSSESDNANKPAGSSQKSVPKPRPKASPRVVEKPKTSPKKNEKPIKTERHTSSASSASSTTSATTSSSDSDSSATHSDRKNSKKSVVKVKTENRATSTEGANSDTENDQPKSSKQVTRKLTRSSSTRKSKHVVGKTVFSDTDSDTESTKRSLSRSPVKRAPVVTKGKTKNKRCDSRARANQISAKEEQKCPLEACNSLGHLGGKMDKHFTLEACPMFHNITITDCKTESIERLKREEKRKKAFEIFRKLSKNVTQEQKQLLQNLRDLRTQLKSEPTDDTKGPVDKTKEPNLKNFVSDYDLMLFRDAQAIASEKIEEDLKSQTNSKGTKYIKMGKFEMEVWYQSPYPEDYARLPKLYICEFCLRYMKSCTILQRHIVKCVWRHPPGEEVYRKDKISVWEVDGKRYKQYCQNLCLLAKFFLDHKTLYYDVEPFLFYVMTMYDSDGCHTVGYFSKEKNSFLNYNVSCILTLPPYQRQGYGRLLIDFSYLLTRVEGKIGSPEKPLSDLGLISYRSYWKDVLLRYLCSNSGAQLSVKDISQEMAIHSYDIVSTLQALGMMKYWKGKHIILKKQDVIDEYVERLKRRGSLLKEVDASCLRWVPPQPASV